MTDDRLDALLDDAARTYNTPPEPPLEAMWAAIEQKLDEDAGNGAPRAAAGSTRVARGRSPFSWFTGPWLRTAAVLLLGVGIGRATSAFRAGPAGEAGATAAGDTVVQWVEEQWLSDQYLGQTAALLIALPAELGAKRPDSSYTARADELLLQTRLLLDSPNASDPLLRTLLEDLELVLVQVVRLHSDRDPLKIDLLKQALEQREVMPRLQHAVISHIGD